MTITVNTSASDSRLTQLATVKNELGETSTDYDSVIDEFIRQASDYIVRYTGRKFAKETITETLRATGDTRLMLSRTPIKSVTQITYDGSTISSTVFEIEDPGAGFIWRYDGWTNTNLYRHLIERFPYGDGRKLYSVNYVAGYVTPGSTDGTRDLPYDIERACIDIVKMFFNRKEEDPNVKMQRTGDAWEIMFDNEGDLPPQTRAILSRWKRADLNNI